MPSYASLVVATLPRRRAVRALRGARAAASAARRGRGVECSRASQTSRFVPDLRHLPFAPGRVGVMSWAATPEVLDEVDGDIRTELGQGATETWRVLLQPVRVHGDWLGYVPDVSETPPLTLDEPLAVMINGILRPRHGAKFVRDNVRVARQLQSAGGYLGGLGMSDTPLTTTSFSCWRSSRESRAFSFGHGAHQQAYKIDQAEGRHRTEFFVRFRVLGSEGTLEGRDPFAGVRLGLPDAAPLPVAEA